MVPVKAVTMLHSQQAVLCKTGSLSALTTNLAAVLPQQTIKILRKPLIKFHKRSGKVLENLKSVSIKVELPQSPVSQS